MLAIIYKQLHIAIGETHQNKSYNSFIYHIFKIASMPSAMLVITSDRAE